MRLSTSVGISRGIAIGASVEDIFGATEIGIGNNNNDINDILTRNDAEIIVVSDDAV